MTDEERNAWQFCGKLAEAIAEASGYTGPEDPPQLVQHVAALRAASARFTEQEALTILRNMGHDVECGACMALAFTGVGLPADEHTCPAEDLRAANARQAEEIAELRAALEDSTGLLASFANTEFNDEGAVTDQVVANRKALSTPKDPSGKE